ncbi:MAG: LysM peptidoglycan-binding domain-containing protein, partial [Caldilineae bacterium]
MDNIHILSIGKHLRRSVVLAACLMAVCLAWAPGVHAEEGVYVVGRGDSLSAIAKRYNVTLADLARLNGITDPNVIYVGQRLVIPGSEAARAIDRTPSLRTIGDGYYTVQRGDTLAQVAKNYGMTVNDLLRLNGLSNPNFIWVGQKLRISARVAALPPEKDAKPVLADAIYVVKANDTLAQIAKDHNTTVHELMVANGLPNPNFVWVGQRLRIKSAAPAPSQLAANAPANGRRWIEVNLSTQTLTAWQGNVPVLHTLVSTGVS